MTAQIPDSIFLQDQKFSLVGVNGSELFDLARFNIHPFPSATSCWRGYVCTYKTQYNKLLLDQLEINLHQPGPVIGGVEPSLSAGIFNTLYRNLNLQIDFTGELLAADKFIRELYVHMGFHPAWKYQTVYELVISGAVVLNTKNVSGQMAQIREQMTRQPLNPPTK